MEIAKEYIKYRWFFTSSGKLVIGGKSAAQNDDLLKKLKRQSKDFVVMHTATPGSPFSILLAPIKDIKPSDLEQAAIFTGCFSRAWRAGKKKEQIHIFKLSQLYKESRMKTGTWGVNSPITKQSVSLELALTKQKGKLRAVPISTPKKKDILLKIKPGKLEKTHALPKFQIEISEHLRLPPRVDEVRGSSSKSKSKREGLLLADELISALPPGGVAISREKKK